MTDAQLALLEAIADDLQWLLVGTHAAHRKRRQDIADLLAAVKHEREAEATEALR